AEADIVRAKGQAEADAMNLKAAAYQDYSQAAVLDKMLSSMPELARAMAQGLANVDRIAIVSTGDGRGGASAITGEVAKMVAQVPELMEALTGMKFGDMLDRLQGVSNAPSARPSTNGVALKSAPRDGDASSSDGAPKP
ncbi:MAG: flotillin family protein, partial [Chloroflexi bacterium]|nr:flotillin family protein [Chloroflexota bacterium]